jgi:hypothetical protein
MAYGAGPMASIVLAATALAGLVNAQPAHAGADTARPQPLTVATSGGGAWWGIDTVTNVETGNIIAQTTSELGAPQFVGRYLIYSSELSGTEARYIHQQGLSILLIDDPNRAFTSGTTDAQQALAQATSLGVAQGVAIFRDVETSDPVTSTSPVSTKIRSTAHSLVRIARSSAAIPLRCGARSSTPASRSRQARIPVAQFVHTSRPTFRDARTTRPPGSTSSGDCSPPGPGRTSTSTSCLRASPKIAGADAQRRQADRMKRHSGDYAHRRPRPRNPAS